MKINQYIIKYKGVRFPSITLAAKYAEIKRTTLAKAVNVAFNNQSERTLTVYTMGLEFEVTQFKLN